MQETPLLHVPIHTPSTKTDPSKWLVEMEMKTMAYNSAGFYYAPRNLYCTSTTRLPTILSASGTPVLLIGRTPHPHHRPKSSFSSVQPSSRLDDERTPTVLGRREAAVSFTLRLGLGFVGTTTTTTLLLQSQLPCEAGASPVGCELTQVVSSGLAFCDKTVGTGPEATKGQLIKAHYVGMLEDGKIFDSSYERGKPLTFHVGVGEVIKGWDQGILGIEGVPPMLAGGKRTLRLPPELGYGTRGAGCRGGSCIIPPNSVLVFDVEFIGKV